MGSKKEIANKYKKSTQKCWECKNISTCDWGRLGKPIDGWKAKKVKIKYGSAFHETYDIKDCPKFEEGQPETKIEHYDALIEAILAQFRTDFTSAYLEVLIEGSTIGKVTDRTKREYLYIRESALTGILSEIWGDKTAEKNIERMESLAENYFDIAEEWARGADEKELAEKYGKWKFNNSMLFLRGREPFKSRRRESLKNQAENVTI